MQIKWKLDQNKCNLRFLKAKFFVRVLAINRDVGRDIRWAIFRSWLKHHDYIVVEGIISSRIGRFGINNVIICGTLSFFQYAARGLTFFSFFFVLFWLLIEFLFI